jgi:glycerophosphoryl diester phosphodiesterase
MNILQTDSVHGYKKLVLSIFLFGLASLLFAGCSEQPKKTDVKIVAHRGGITERPENTISAFKRSVESGADILEFDLRTSKDGQLFILHDKTLDRTTNGTGQATSFTMDELRKLDAGSWFDPSWAGERIPSFQEVLQWATDEEIVLLLDLKESGREFAEKVAGEVHKYGEEGKIIVGVHSPVQAREFGQLLSGSQQLGFISSPDEIPEFALAGVDVIRLWLYWLEEKPFLADQVRKTGAKLMINGTSGELDEVKLLKSFSPDWILINDPAQLIKSLRELR